MKLNFYLLKEFIYKKNSLPIVIELLSEDVDVKISEKLHLKEIRMILNNQEILNIFMTDSLSLKRNYCEIKKGTAKYYVINLSEYFDDDICLISGFYDIAIKTVIHELCNDEENRIYEISCTKNLFIDL